MARYTYNASLVSQALEELTQASKSLDNTNIEIQKGINMINDARGAENIDCDFTYITNYQSQVIECIEAMNKDISDKAREIEEYQDAPWYTKLFATLGLGALKLVEGLGSFVENIGDSIVSIAGFFGGIFSSEFQDCCAEFVKKDHVGDFFYDQYEEGGLQGVNKYSIMSHESTAANVLKGIGNATGYILVGVATGGMGFAGTAITAGVAGLGGIGSGTQSGLQAGMTFNQAFGQGVKEGAIAAGTTLILDSAFRKLSTVGSKNLLAKSATVTDDLIKQGVNSFDDLAKVGINSLDDLAKAGVRGADDLARLGINSVDDMAKLNVKSIKDLAKVGVGSADDLVKVGINSADDLVKVGVNSVDDLAKAGIKSVDDLAKVGINSADDLSKLGVKSAKDLSKMGINSADDLVKVGVNSADDLSKLGVKSAKDLTKVGVNSADDLAKLGIKSTDDLAKVGLESTDELVNAASKGKIVTKLTDNKIVNGGKKITAKLSDSKVANNGKQMVNKIGTKADNVITKFGTQTKAGQAIANFSAKAGPRATGAIAAGTGQLTSGGIANPVKDMQMRIQNNTPESVGVKLYNDTQLPNDVVRVNESTSIEPVVKNPTYTGSSASAYPNGNSGTTNKTITAPSFERPTIDGGTSNSTPNPTPGGSTTNPTPGGGTTNPTPGGSTPNPTPGGGTSNPITGGGTLPGGGSIGNGIPNINSGGENYDTIIGSSDIEDTLSNEVMNALGNTSGSLKELAANSTNIPTSSTPLISETNLSPKSASVLPIAAGLGAAGLAGIGTKAYLDKRENNDEEEEDMIETEEWQEDPDSMDIDYEDSSEEEYADYLTPADEYAFQEN